MKAEERSYVMVYDYGEHVWTADTPEEAQEWATENHLSAPAFTQVVQSIGSLDLTQQQIRVAESPL